MGGHHYKVWPPLKGAGFMPAPCFLIVELVIYVKIKVWYSS